MTGEGGIEDLLCSRTERLRASPAGDKPHCLVVHKDVYLLHGPSPPRFSRVMTQDPTVVLAAPLTHDFGQARGEAGAYTWNFLPETSLSRSVIGY